MKTVGIDLAEKRNTPRITDTRAKLSRRRVKWGDLLAAYLMIAPLMLGLAIFYIWPIFQTFYFSFTSWGAFGRYKWIGLENYQQLLADTELGRALFNTFLYTIISVPASIACSIVVAVLLNQRIRGVGIYRTLYYLPSVTMPAAIAVVWRWLYNGDYGLINHALSFFSIQGPRWVSDPQIALYSVILVAIWTAIGHNMVLFLAGLQSIPSMYYEAASIDGAGPFTRFFRITLPLLSPTIFFVTIISLISAFQVFDLIFLMLGNSAVLEASQTVVYLFYKHAFMTNDKGYAATIAMLLFVIIMLITALQFRLQRSWVHYS